MASYDSKIKNIRDIAYTIFNGDLHDALDKIINYEQQYEIASSQLATYWSSFTGRLCYWHLCTWILSRGGKISPFINMLQYDTLTQKIIILDNIDWKSLHVPVGFWGEFPVEWDILVELEFPIEWNILHN